MKKLRYVLLILLMMIAIPLKIKADGGAGVRFECPYTFTLDNSKYLVIFKFAITDDTGYGTEDNGPYGMNIQADLYKNGYLQCSDPGYDSSSNCIEHDTDYYTYDGDDWDEFHDLYVTGQKNAKMKTGDDPAQKEVQTQECPAQIYAGKRGTKRVGFSTKQTGTHNSVANLVKPPSLTCHYQGFAKYDYSGDSDDDYMFFNDISLKFTSWITDIGWNGTDYNPTWAQNKWRFSMLDHVSSTAECKQPNGVSSDSDCKRKDGYAKLFLINSKKTFVGGCPTSLRTYEFAGDTVAHIDVNRGKSGSDGISYTNFYKCDRGFSNDADMCPKGNGMGYEDIEVEKPHPYQNVNICDKNSIEYIQKCGCMPASLTDLTSRIYLLLKIAAPALLLIIGGFEMVKAMTASDESAIKKAQQKLIKKFVAAAMVFLLMTVIQFLASVLGTDQGTLECVDYILNGYQV